MTFLLTYSDGRSKTFKGDSTYEIKENGMLVVTDDDGTVITHSPVGWGSVRDTGGPARPVSTQAVWDANDNI